MALTLWEFLFKYPPLVWEKGRLVFGISLPWWLLALAAVLVAGIGWSYVRRSDSLLSRERLGLLVLRSALLGLLLFVLFRPTLQVPVAVPQENYVALLIDDSRSMTIADDGREARGAEVQRRIEQEVMESLSDRFRVRTFRFGGGVERIDDVGAMTFTQGQTRIGQALDQVRGELAGLPLAGLVVISDGADQYEAELNSALLGLRTASVPVYTVGVGREQFDRDIEIRRVSTPRSVLRGTSMMVDVVIAQNGYAGRTVPLIVEDEGRIVNTQDVQLPLDGTPAAVRVHFTAEDPGWRRFTFRVPVQDEELVRENNSREALVEVRDGRQKVLYLEGEPRFEVKFLRRAVEDDPQLQLVVLQRTAENKFLRLDVDDGEELEHGFPTTREELFQYRGLILGSVEASFFTPQQQRMIVDFVAERGGSLLTLGGRRSFNEGGYAGTVLDELIPVQLSEARDPSYYTELTVLPTRAGQTHAALQLSDDPAVTNEIWGTLPALSAFNRVTAVKPGATTLLSGTVPGSREEHVVLAYQRYGRGLSLSLPVQDTWLWQMHADIPVEDETHQTLWRQLLRWMVSEVPGPLTFTTSREPAPLNQPLRLQAELRDEAFRRVNDGVLSMFIETPDGNGAEMPMQWTARRDGEYQATFVPSLPGRHLLRVVAEREGGEPLAGSLMLDAVEDDGEFFGAGLRAPLLRRIADETGGRFYPLADIGRMPEEIRYSGSGVTRVESFDLWDMPLVFLLMIGLVGAEWSLRRWKGLP